MPESEVSLDGLAERAIAGDEPAETELFTRLGVSLRSVAKRRVREDDVEDLVQDALRIVHAKYRDRPGAAGLLPWSFAVLRNVVGNHYQARRRERREEPLDENVAAGPAVTSELESRERRILLARAIRELGRENPRCETFLRRIIEAFAEGGSTREISTRVWETVQGDDPRLSRGTFYVALHRCRERLRALLAVEGEW